MRIEIGKLVFNSGAVVTYAAKKLEVKWGHDGVVQAEYHFTNYGDIGAVKVTNWTNVDCIIVDHFVEIDDEKTS